MLDVTLPVRHTETTPAAFPRAVQPWGALLVADETSLKVVLASANLAAILGRRAEETLGQTLGAVIGRDKLKQLLPYADKKAAPWKGLTLTPRRGRLGALALSVHRLDGRIYVEMEPAAGPVDAKARVARPHIMQSLHDASDPEGLFAVADDGLTIRWLLQRQLQKLGFVVDAAENGEAALRKLRAGDYDLLLTDCHMPVMDGAGLARAVRADATLRGLPVIGLTADVTDRQRLLCEQAGMNEMAIKPMTTEALSDLLQRHLAKAKKKGVLF